MGMRPHGAGGAIGRLANERKKATRPLTVLLKSLAGFMKGLGGLLAAATAINIIYSVIQLVNPLILSTGINLFSKGVTEGQIILFEKEFPLNTVIIVLTLVFAALSFIGFLLNSISTRILSRTNARMVNKIRIDLYHKLINSSMNYIKNEQSGNI
ncbi:MAG: ABC transporter transmembrane domain-containing protein, partial [Candidatus Thorarchaeota archaeon]